MVAPRPATTTISDITRRAIADWFTLSSTPWMGAMTEAAFVGRVFDLARLSALLRPTKTRTGEELRYLSRRR
jgi:hypothetical protein